MEPELLQVISPVARSRIPEERATLPSSSLGWDIPLSKGSKRDFVYDCREEDTEADDILLLKFSIPNL